MGRPRIGGNRPKVKIGISLDAELYAWIAERTGPGREFSSISHGIERSIASFQKADEPQGSQRPQGSPTGPSHASQPSHGAHASHGVHASHERADHRRA